MTLLKILTLIFVIFNTISRTPILLTLNQLINLSYCHKSQQFLIFCEQFYSIFQTVKHKHSFENQFYVSHTGLRCQNNRRFSLRTDPSQVLPFCYLKSDLSRFFMYGHWSILIPTYYYTYFHCFGINLSNYCFSCYSQSTTHCSCLYYSYQVQIFVKAN